VAGRGLCLHQSSVLSAGLDHKRLQLWATRTGRALQGCNGQRQLATATGNSNSNSNWQLATFNGNCNIKHLWADGVCVGFWSWTFAWVDPVDVDVDVDPVDMVDRWDHH